MKLFKIIFIFFSVIVLFINICYSQSSGINFQGVARNSNNGLLVSQKISLRLSIISLNVNGNLDYSESRIVNTNQQGSFSIVIGDTGSISKTGKFDTINWSVNPKYLKVEMDQNAGTSYVVMGITQLQSVPYSYYASSVNAKNILGVLPINSGGTGSSSQSFVDLNSVQTVSGDKKFTGATTISNSLSGGNISSSNISGFTANINNQTSTTYMLLASDNGKIVTLNNTNSISVSVPQALPIGFNCMLIQQGAGQITISGLSGVSILNRYGFMKTSGQYSAVTILSLASNSFIISGDLSN